MQPQPPSWPTFASELMEARDALDLGTEIGLALRADRHKRGLSQRAYAAVRGLTLSSVIRLESAAIGLKLGDVVAALDGTDFVLCLCHRPQSPEPVLARESGTPALLVARPETAPEPVHPAYWPRSELVARVRGSARRFPAHHVVQQTSSAPPWWWYAESTRASSVAPNWYAPQFTQRREGA